MPRGTEDDTVNMLKSYVNDLHISAKQVCKNWNKTETCLTLARQKFGIPSRTSIIANNKNNEIERVNKIINNTHIGPIEKRKIKKKSPQSQASQKSKKSSNNKQKTKQTPIINNLSLKIDKSKTEEISDLSEEEFKRMDEELKEISKNNLNK